jgi:hypothetical protein
MLKNKTHLSTFKIFCADSLTAKLLLALSNKVVLGSESHGTHDHILLSDGSGSLQTTNCGDDV